jgi:hypothetical protein
VDPAGVAARPTGYRPRAARRVLGLGRVDGRRVVRHAASRHATSGHVTIRFGARSPDRVAARPDDRRVVPPAGSRGSARTVRGRSSSPRPWSTDRVGSDRIEFGVSGRLPSLATECVTTAVRRDVPIGRRETRKPIPGIGRATTAGSSVGAERSPDSSDTVRSTRYGGVRLRVVGAVSHVAAPLRTDRSRNDSGARRERWSGGQPAPSLGR